MLVSHNDDAHKTSSYFKLTAWAIPMSLAIFLVLLSTVNFLLFHTLAEFFSITIALLAFVVSWQMYSFSKNHFLMYLGCGYIWIAVLDMAHTLSYKGLNLIPDTDSDTSIKFWLGTRFLESLLLLTAPLFLHISLNRKVALALFGIVAVSFVYIVLITDIIPPMFIEGYGLTDIKIYGEYFVIFLLFLSIIHLWKNKKFIEKRIVDVMVVAISLTICAELAFTFYVDIYGLSNLVGHVFKMFSFWLIYLAIVRTTLQEPFAVMSRRATTYDAIPDATIIVDKDGKIRQANRKASMLSNMPIEKLYGKTSHEVFHPKNNRDNCPVCQAVINIKEVDSIEMKIQDGVYFDFSISPLIDTTDAHGCVEVIRDISARKQAEKKFNELNLLKNSIIENLPHMLFVKDANEHRYVEFNRAAEELTGMTKEEMIGKNDYDFWPREQAQFFIDKDREVINSGSSLDVPEEPITTKIKGTRILHTKKIPIYNDDGNPSYLLGISEDITEKLKTEEMLRRTQKLDAIGQMSGGIAHDFNNQLGVIIGYLELFSDSGPNEKQSKWIKLISGAAKRCVELTRQLLVFSRVGGTDKVVVNVNHIINDMNVMIERVMTPEIHIDYQLDIELYNVDLNPGELQDAILNILINARDAMLNGGNLTVRTSNVNLDQHSSLILAGELDQGEYVLITISDTGDGMSKDVLERIFEPFYTTKGVGKGTGLGLSMVYGFVNRYGGAVDVESEFKKGTTFSIYLPRTSQQTTKLDLVKGNDLQRGTESVLIVDDELGLLSLAEHIITNLGYKTYTAVDGVEAIEILNKEAIDLLFTDVVMPNGINGYELAQKALKINPDIKILLTSGHSEKSGNSAEIQSSAFSLLHKPYKRDELSNILRELLKC